jgi:hypothetical protein
MESGNKHAAHSSEARVPAPDSFWNITDDAQKMQSDRVIEHLQNQYEAWRQTQAACPTVLVHVR